MWNYQNPVSIHAGTGSLSRLSDIVGNRDCLLVTFPEAAEFGLIEQIRSLLGDRLRGIISEVQPNPDVRWLAPLYERVHRDWADVPCLIALGGGSAIDTAKALMCNTSSKQFSELLQAITQGVTLPPGSHKALIAIPTTAGTGSEVTPWATIWDHAAGRKHSLHQPWTWPEVALIDPALMLTLPAAATLASGLDALSHALESIWNIHRNPVSTAMASRAAQQILQVLPALMQDLSDLALRTKMAEAALQAGLAFSNTKTALAHSLSYEVTLAHGVAHGIACSFSLPCVLALALGADAETDQVLLGIFEARTSDEAIKRLRSFLHELGVATDPLHYGVSPHAWTNMMATASQGPRGRNFIRTTATA